MKFVKKKAVLQKNVENGTQNYVNILEKEGSVDMEKVVPMHILRK